MTEQSRCSSANYRGHSHKEKTMTRSSKNDSGISTSPCQKDKSVRENKPYPKDMVRVEVLEEKIKIDSKNHEQEKRRITSEKNQIINRLEADNENLKIEVAMKSDKIKQLDIANDKKEFQLEHKDTIIKGMRDENRNLKQRVEDLHHEIKHLEGEKQKMTEKHNQTVEQQSDKIKEMEERITELKTELHKVKSELEKNMMEKLTMMGDKMEAREKEAKSREEERERKMLKREQQKEEEAKKRERLREEEWIRREEKSKEEAKKNMQSLEDKMEKMMSEIVRSRNLIQQDIKATTRGIPRNDNLVITEARHFQIQNDNHYYGEHSPVRQSVPGNRGNIQPPTRFSFPAKTFQARRGVNQRNLYR